MKHCRLALPFAACRWSPVVVSLVLACSSSSGEATLLVDSTSLRESSEVVAVPVDPLSLRTRPATASLPASPADTIATAAALQDSADRLDAVFQREREALNVEARLLEALPPASRRSPDYARRYASFASRLEPILRLRALRDSARSRAHRLHPAGAAAYPSPATIAADSSARAALLGAVDGLRRSVVMPAAPVVRMRLARGEWWIGVGATGHHPARFSHVTLAGRNDTIHIPAQ